MALLKPYSGKTQYAKLRAKKREKKVPTDSISKLNQIQESTRINFYTFLWSNILFLGPPKKKKLSWPNH